eukprot:scaffold53422_cov62-Phaeocystis_antarctica.AAC.3
MTPCPRSPAQLHMLDVHTSCTRRTGVCECECIRVVHMSYHPLPLSGACTEHGNTSFTSRHLAPHSTPLNTIHMSHPLAVPPNTVWLWAH